MAMKPVDFTEELTAKETVDTVTMRIFNELPTDKQRKLEEIGGEGESHEILQEHTILHESEFLQEVYGRINDHQYGLCGIYMIEDSFLEGVTNIPAKVFKTLRDAEMDVEINSIIAATIGRIQFAKLCLDYYGIERFIDIDGRPQKEADIGDGYYLFCHC
ncbi:hypothetical protein [Bacillus piscicola]|uniref:hypothetical protein n=1 Tax=Bacillus piscicola TaxID=1632684 RepID=UPI001F09CF6C|nr:hypothetical protein [Bacillus piscicola]